MDQLKALRDAQLRAEAEAQFYDEQIPVELAGGERRTQNFLPIRPPFPLSAPLYRLRQHPNLMGADSDAPVH